MRLKDKVYIITGATSGMGKAMAFLFAKEGAKLVLSGRDLDKGASVLSQIQQMNGSALFIPGDVCDPLYNQKLVDTALSAYGQLNGLITNAGELGLGEITETTIESWNKTFSVNVDSIFYLLKAALPHISRNSENSILINASIAAFKSFPNHPAYCASKAAAVALARQSALDYAPIRINCICPGPVDTPLIHASAVAFPDPAQAVAAAGQSTLLKRLGLPEDVAELALFLMADTASWITGSVFTIDGGILASR
jgi:NAD(P)-dependent dehydrogenase (short-subunit alcohol dehydrogenase family)